MGYLNLLANVIFNVRFSEKIIPDEHTGKKKLVIPIQYGKGA